MTMRITTNITSPLYSKNMTFDVVVILNDMNIYNEIVKNYQ